MLPFCDLFRDINVPALQPAVQEALKSEIGIVRVERGEVLMKQGDPAECMYVVVSGRFEVVVEGPDHDRNLVGEVRSGETVGELGLIDGSPRMATVIASRNSQLVRVSVAGFKRLVLSNAGALLNIARAEAGRMRMLGQRRGPFSTVRTIVVVGAEPGDALNRVTTGICEELGKAGSVLRVSRSQFEALFGENHIAEVIAGGLCSLENAHRFVVCEAEAEPSQWTIHCLRQADRILTVRNASGSPELSPAERAISDEQKSGGMPLVELVLLHENDGIAFPGTSRWLEPRRVLRHHHVRSSFPADLGRVARLLSGRAIGLVLGGGGARGFAHIGVLRAIEEAGIPIDMVGGVSMGSIISALYAMGNDWSQLVRLAKRELTNKWASDITLPIVALSTGRRFRRALQDLFGDRAIEDLRLGYFCSSCNLSTAENVVHRTGLLSMAVHASNAIPVVLPPVLSGGHLLIDGGVLNNQPGDILKDLCGGSVIVNNVSPRRDATVDASLTEMPSAWRILRSWMNPFEPTLRVPGIVATMIRTLTVASERKSREVERMSDFYLRPPLDLFRLDDYERIEEIVEIGYEYAREEIRGWKESGRYPVPETVKTSAGTTSAPAVLPS